MSRASEPGDAAVEVVFVRTLDLRGDDLADTQRPAAGKIDRAIDLRCIGFRAAFGHGRTDLVDNDLLPCADLAFQPARGNRLLPCHQRVPALLLDVLRDGITER